VWRAKSRASAGWKTASSPQDSLPGLARGPSFCSHLACAETGQDSWRRQNAERYYYLTVQEEEK
jgi:hypothetical protein